MDDGTILNNRVENFIIKDPHASTINRTVVTSRDPERRAKVTRRDIIDGDTTYYNHLGEQIEDPSTLVRNLDKYFRIRRTGGSTAEERERNRLLAIPQGEDLPEYQQGGINDGLQQQPNESVSAGNVVTNTINTSPQVTVDGNSTTYREDSPYTGPRYYRREFTTDNTGAQVPTYFSGRDPENLKRIRNYALVNRGPYYRTQQIFDNIDRGKLKKQGGTINKFQQKGGWLFQQGGQMPQEGSQEELVLDFAVRYLVTMGVPEEDIMDPQGNLNPEHQQELEQVFKSQEIA